MVFQAKLFEKGEKKPVADWIEPSQTTINALHSMQEAASENLD